MGVISAFRQRAHEAGRDADDETKRLDLFAFAHDGAGSDDAATADMGTGEHDGADADQTAVFDGAGVQIDPVPGSDIAADDTGQIWSRVVYNRLGYCCARRFR
jgi:hypothetical protein